MLLNIVSVANDVCFLCRVQLHMKVVSFSLSSFLYSSVGWGFGRVWGGGGARCCWKKLGYYNDDVV